MRRAAALVFVAACGFSATARAEVEITPAGDGAIGALLVRGPIAKGSPEELGRALPDASAETPGGRFRVIESRDGGLDLDRALGTGQKPGAQALLGGVLTLSEDLDGWLLLSVDGAVRAFVDGQRVFERKPLALRGSAWDAVRLRLVKGRHPLVLHLTHPGTWWVAELRLLDARDSLAPRGARLALPGTDESETERLARSLLSVFLQPNPDARGFGPSLELDYRRGSPLGQAAPSRARVGGVDLALGPFPLAERGATRQRVRLPRVPAEAAPKKLEVELMFGPVKERRTLVLDAELPKLLARADGAAAGLRSRKTLDPTTLEATLEDARARAESGTAEGKAALSALLSDLEAGRDPLALPGVRALARRSKVDGEPDPVWVHVPSQAASATDRRFPLVVLLHGLNGNPSRILEAFIDSKNRGPAVDGFLIAPHAHGNAFYRGPGEREVLDAIDWALATYPIDPDRVSISGVSMGGTGTGHIGLWYADRFSAAAPLCGYHSYFVRRDTRGRPLRAWERQQMLHWSPASVAERGQNLPLWVAHGTKDFPLENSRVLVDRYKELGYTITDEWPDTGHDVWTKAYAGARLFPWLARAKRAAQPAKLTVKTDSLRFGRLGYASILELGEPSRMALLEVDATKPARVVVKTDQVSAFALERGTRLPKDGELSLLVDGAEIGFGPGEAIALRRSAGSWQKGVAPARGKRAGLEGPIRDVFLEPVVFSFGSADPGTVRANREVALALARRHGSEVGYRVVADTELDATTIGKNAIVAVGTPRDHSLLARVSSRLPIRADAGAVVVGERRFGAGGTGAIFIHPNPEAPERYLVVVTGSDAAGIWRALSLPPLLPDFLVYDAELGPAAAEILLGANAKTLAQGFFDLDWKLPAQIDDTPG